MEVARLMEMRVKDRVLAGTTSKKGRWGSKSGRRKTWRNKPTLSGAKESLVSTVP